MHQQTGNLSSTERTWSALLGSALAIMAVRRGNPILRSLAAATGASLIARSAAGHCAVKSAMTGATSLREGLREQWERMPFNSSGQQQYGAPGSPVHAARSQAVDRSVEESFPASDPPASRLPDEPPSNAQDKWQAARAANQAEPAG